jgi:DNA-binding MarR family transcriptional regulator
VLYYSYVNEEIAYSLIHAAHSIESQFEKALAAVSLSGPKFAALSVLVAQDQPLSLSELAEKLTCVRSNVTQLVDRLEADGLVKRTDDPTDRRGVRAQVTKLGRERQAAGSKVVNRVHEEVAKQFSAVDQSALKRALDTIQ